MDRDRPLELIVIAYQEGDPQHVTVLTGEAFKMSTGETTRVVKNPGYSIAQLRTRFGGDEGYLVDPRGGRHHLSLKPWAHLDPEKTRLRIRYRGPRFKDAAGTAEARRRAESGQTVDSLE